MYIYREIYRERERERERDSDDAQTRERWRVRANPARVSGRVYWGPHKPTPPPQIRFKST